MKKIALFAFQGEPMCFIHVLLNALEMKAKGYEAQIVIEGMAVKLVPEMMVEGSLLNPLYRKARGEGLIAGACRACSAKFKVLDAVEAEGLPILDDMSGHAGMFRFLNEGFEIITF